MRAAGLLTVVVQGLFKFSPDLPQKKLSMSLVVALPPGFFRIWLGSRLIPYRRWFCRTYWRFCWSVWAQLG